MTLKINMNGNLADPNYRYTFDQFNINIGGRGNGVFTRLLNIDHICEQLNHPVHVIIKYLASAVGSSYNLDTNVITGNHSQEVLTEHLLEYIKYIVMCPNCFIPETIPKLALNNKLYLECFSCNHIIFINNISKRANKGVDIIIKYFKSNGIWPQRETKHLTESQTQIQNHTQTNFNPFD
jgi:translation initiation factor 5